MAFGDRHGCLPMETKFLHKWPLALDVLKRQYEANSEQHLMAFQSKFFDKLGPNMELKLFGAVGYMTIEPKNVEAILSTRFEGMSRMTITDRDPSDAILLFQISASVLDVVLSSPS